MNKKTRSINENELKEIIKCLKYGFTYTEKNIEKTFRKNDQVLLAVILESNLGLRISDIKKLTKDNFENGCLKITEKKTGKLQYRELNKELYDTIKKYIKDNNIQENEKLIKITDTAIQKQLRIVCKYLNLKNVSTHSFRKFFANRIYNNTNNIEIVREALNHTDINVTNTYINDNHKKLDEIIKKFYIK